MNKEKIKTGVNKVCETSIQFNRYFDDDNAIVEALNDTDKLYLEQLLVRYEVPRNQNKPIIQLRVSVIKALLKDRLDFDALNKLVNESKKRNPAVYRSSWRTMISIFHILLDFGETSDFLKIFAEQLIEDLSLEHSTIKIVGFEGSRNQATKSPWLGLYNTTKRHNESYRLTIQFDNENIKCGLSFEGEWMEHIKEFNQDNFNYRDLLEFLNTLKTYIEDDTAVNSQQNSDNKGLNTILYGPPGTGKTYSTSKKAVCIIDSNWCSENSPHEEVQLTDVQLEEIKQKYDEFVESSQIVFATFHQSFSYEDFIQGISAELNNKGQLQYEVKSGIFKKLCDKADENPDKKYVLIIDEINRGNISKIFGELITLLEKDKRKGGRNPLAVKLPHSKDDESFSIPSNVYVVGTMNTADKSLANIDLALRRRFDFEEIPPRYDILEGKLVEGVKISQLLKIINQRIEVLIDRDHLIGHSYMLDVASFDDLKSVFKKNIIPLLQEYFYDDWDRIRWVLNDHRKDQKYQFIRSGGVQNINQLFGENVDNKVSDRRFYINQDAFDDIASYKGILNNND